MRSAKPVHLCVLQCSMAYTWKACSASHTGCRQGRAFRTHVGLSAARRVETALPWHASLRGSEHLHEGVLLPCRRTHHTSTQLGHMGQGLGTAQSMAQ